MHAVVIETFILSTSLFCSQSVVGHAYSNEKYRKGEQVALCRGLCQSWSILYEWNTGSCYSEFCCTFDSKGPLDWNLLFVGQLYNLPFFPS